MSDEEAARWYRAFVQREWCAPTVAEFAAYLGVRSKSTAQEVLFRLAGKGLIKRKGVATRIRAC